MKKIILKLYFLDTLLNDKTFSFPAPATIFFHQFSKIYCKFIGYFPGGKKLENKK